MPKFLCARIDREAEILIKLRRKNGSLFGRRRHGRSEKKPLEKLSGDAERGPEFLAEPRRR